MFADYDADGVAEVMGLAGQNFSGSAAGGFREEGSAHGFRFDLIDIPQANPARVGRLPSLSPTVIERAVEQGLPRQVLRHLAERITGGDKAKVAALEWSVVPKTTLERRETRLSPYESERTERVARLFVHARRALGSEDEARAFVVTSHPELDGRSPIEAAKTDLGTRRVEQLLNALEYGLVI